MFQSKKRDQKELENSLKELLAKEEIKNDAKLSGTLAYALSKLQKGDSAQSVASNLNMAIKEHWSEKELPKEVIDLQLELGKWSSFGANGVVF